MSVSPGQRLRRMLRHIVHALTHHMARRLATGLGLAGLLGGAAAQAPDEAQGAPQPQAPAAVVAQRAQLEARVAQVRQAALDNPAPDSDNTAGTAPATTASTGNPPTADGAPPIGPAADDSVAWNNWPKWSNWANWANG